MRRFFAMVSLFGFLISASSVMATSTTYYFKSDPGEFPYLDGSTVDIDGTTVTSWNLQGPIFSFDPGNSFFDGSDILSSDATSFVGEFYVFAPLGPIDLEYYGFSDPPDG